MFCQYYYLLISVPLSGDMSHANLAIQREKDTEAFLRVGKRIIIYSIHNCALEVVGEKTCCLFALNRNIAERSSTIFRYRWSSTSKGAKCYFPSPSSPSPFRAYIKTEGGRIMHMQCNYIYTSHLIGGTPQRV